MKKIIAAMLIYAITISFSGCVKNINSDSQKKIDDKTENNIHDEMMDVIDNKDEDNTEENKKAESNEKTEKTVEIDENEILIPREPGTYYVDSKDGNDDNDGLSEDRAFKTLDKVNRTTFIPGDVILFKAGSVWEDAVFIPKGSGNEEYPIIVDVYGDVSSESDKPCINAGHKINGGVSAGIIVKNVEYWEINNLQVTNMGDAIRGLAKCYGIYLNAHSYGVMEHIYIRNMYIHDVQGKLDKANDEGTGIFFQSSGIIHSKFNDLRIEYNHLERVARNGIGSIFSFSNRVWSLNSARPKPTDDNAIPYRSTNVFIRGNLLEAIAGDGIKAWGCDGALVEYNIIRGAQMNAGGASAGIWPFDSDHVIVQYNEVSGVMGTVDGQAFDIDYYTTNTIFQYNYSHDNAGGFMLFCAPGYAPSSGNVVRYNISQNDGSAKGWNDENQTGRLLHFGGGNTDTFIYNNTFYIGPDQAGYQLIKIGTWDNGAPLNINFVNNVFIVESTDLTAFFTTPSNQSYLDRFTWENNVFLGKGFMEGGNLSRNMPSGQVVLPDENPLEHFHGPGNAMFGMIEAGEAYMLRKDSSLINAGSIVNEDNLIRTYHLGDGKQFEPDGKSWPYAVNRFTNYNYGLDFRDQEVDTKVKRDIGAVQSGESNMLPAPDINRIELTEEGVVIEFDTVDGADDYIVIYGNVHGFGYGARNVSSDNNRFVIDDIEEAGEYFFTVCARNFNGCGFYSQEKRILVTDVSVLYNDTD